MRTVSIYDTTLRDGAQGEGISFSAAAKIRLARRLDAFGIDYIEGGFAGSNPKDMEFFRRLRKEPLARARLAAFGSTRRKQARVAEDPQVAALLEAETPVVTVVGKSWKLHVEDILGAAPEENLAMISDTIRHLKANDREVLFDAEHFFDGYKDSPAFALETLKAAADAGADRIILCDTNGGCLPSEIFEITGAAAASFGPLIGIHTHNDAELAVANSLEAVRAGATQIQGTMNGFGERTGNANLCSILPGLILKMGCRCLLENSLAHLTEVSEFVYEMANLRPYPKAPYVGQSAFAHKAGMHVDGVRKNARSFEHLPPEQVGNRRRVLVSELAGGSNIFLKAVQMGVGLTRSSPEVREILRELERMEKEGYEFEAAEASFHLMTQKILKAHKPFFELQGFRVIVEKRSRDEACLSEATIKLKVGPETALTVGEGIGPVDALNAALRAALLKFYPSIAKVFLTDYRVRILDPEESTAAKTRVLVESSDGHATWSTVGVSENIIEASWEALVDGIEYKLFLEEEANRHE